MRSAQLVLTVLYCKVISAILIYVRSVLHVMIHAISATVLVASVVDDVISALLPLCLAKNTAYFT
jgi:hypothetical protein